MGEAAELLTIETIRNSVYIIRGQQVMLDFDLSNIYGYELKAMNQQVKRNIERFPEDFMFQLEKEEIPDKFLKSQIVTLNVCYLVRNEYGYSKSIRAIRSDVRS